MDIQDGEKVKDNGKGGRNLRGPDTNSSGPFKNGDSTMAVLQLQWDGDIEHSNVLLL